LLLVIVVSYCC